MPISPSERYYLARFASEYHGIPLEKAEALIQDPEVDELESHSFVMERSHLSNSELVGELSEEFLARFQYFDELASAYVRESPEVSSGYIELIQEKKGFEFPSSHDDQTRNWYTGEQVPEIRSELLDALNWLSENVYEESLPEEYTHLFQLNIAAMKYGLHQSDDRISTSFINPYYTFRGKSHNRGVVDKWSLDTYLTDLGERLITMFSNKDSPEQVGQLADKIVDELHPYYNGPTRKFVHYAEKTLAAGVKNRE